MAEVTSALSRTISAALAVEAKDGTLDPSHVPVLPAVPAVRGTTPFMRLNQRALPPITQVPDLGRETIGPREPRREDSILTRDDSQILAEMAAAFNTLKQISDVREGRSGSVLDKNLTMRDLINEGVLSLNVGATRYTGGVADALVLGSGYVDPRPVLLAPPAPTSLTASAAFKNVILRWNLLDYANHAYVEIWRHTADALGAASLIGTSTANVYSDASGTVGTTYYYWVRAVAITAPNATTGVLGPFNAVSGTPATLGSIIGTDLADLIVTADKLSQGTYPNINLVPNPGAEDGTAAWSNTWETVVGPGPPVTFVVDTSTKTGGSQSFKQSKLVAANRGGVGCFAIPVIPGETYAWRVKWKGSSASGSGNYFRAYESVTYPAGGIVKDSLVTSVTSLAADAAITTSFAEIKGTYTVPAGIGWVSLGVLNNAGNTNLDIWWDDVSLGRQITAEFMAANSIAVGTAAIQNGAIVNAMIGTAAIDDAKIANLSAVKITAGTLDVARLGANSITAAKIAANTLTAAEISTTALSSDNTLTRSLTVRDAAGHIVLSSGTVAGGGNLCINSDFLRSSSGIPINFGEYNNGGISFTSSILAGSGPMAGANAWRLHNVGTVANTWGFLFNSAATAFGGFKANTTYTISFYARISTNPSGQQMIDAWNNPPATRYFLQNPVLTSSFQRYVFVCNFGGSTIDTNGFFSISSFTAPAGTDLDFACVQVEQGDMASGWSSAPVTANNPINSSNISTYIANAAIGTAQIGTLNASVITAGTITVDKLQIGSFSGNSTDSQTSTGLTVASGKVSAQTKNGATLTSTVASSKFMVTAAGSIGLTLKGAFSPVGAGSYDLQFWADIEVVVGAAVIRVGRLDWRHNEFCDLLDSKDVSFSASKVIDPGVALGTVLTVRINISVMKYRERTNTALQRDVDCINGAGLTMDTSITEIKV